MPDGLEVIDTYLFHFFLLIKYTTHRGRLASAGRLLFLILPLNIFICMVYLLILEEKNMKRKYKKKLWLDRRSRKIQNKKKKTGKSQSTCGIVLEKDTTDIDVYTAKAPSIFSLVKNTEETNRYFHNIIEQMARKRYKQLFFIDSSEVKEVTTDALVYILALLYNIKLNAVAKYSFKGNLPKDKNAQKVYNESGFMNYVKTRRAVMPCPSDKVQILTGRKTDPNIAKQICDFVNQKFNTSCIFTIDLYKTLIELMSNTVHHAYNCNGIMVPYWYLYSIDKGDSIQFTFIDTGEGIPNTVKKKILERLPFGKVDDSTLIHSAFLGESRTETGLYNRGHGLPALYEKVKAGKLKEFFVLSGCGCCKSVIIDGEIELQKLDFQKEIIGTIFQFEIINVKEDVA